MMTFNGRIISIFYCFIGATSLGQVNPGTSCSGANILTAATTCSNNNYTMTGSLYSNGSSLTCASGLNRDDGYYSFVAVDAYTIVEVTGNRNFAIATYSSCGGSELACDMVSSGSTAMLIFATIPSNTYFIKIDRRSGNNNANMTGTICIYQAKSPGGISPIDLKLWLKADNGTNCTTDACAISSWSDNSTNINSASQSTSANRPAYILTDHNYNPGINFQEANQDLMIIPDHSSLDLGNDHAIFILTDVDAVVDGFISPLSKHSSSYTNDGYGFHAFYSDVSPWYNASDLKTTYAVNVDIGAAASDAATLDVVIDGVPDIILAKYDGVNVSLTKDAGTAFSTAYTTGIVDNNSPMVLGADHDNLAFTSHYDGNLNEVIIYDITLTNAEQRKVETYLAIKYGISLDNTAGGAAGDYTSTENDLIWDASDNSTYHNDVIAIGKDYLEGLVQKQSKTFDDSTRVYVSTLATSNALNTGIITNDVSYIVIGHNNDLLKASSLPSLEQPPGVYSRIAREWKVTNTNFNDDFTVELKLEIPNSNIALSDLRLLVDTDGDFSDASIIAPPAVNFSLGSVIISGIGTAEIPLNSTRYITLASAFNTTPLPVELISFNAAVINNKHVKLNWQTASEVNNDYFVIEKSIDGVEWQVVNSIAGAGNSSILISYTDIDYFPYTGISYYRLKQIDLDGDFSYSEIKSVFLEKIIGFEVKIYPNPTTGQITIEGRKSELEKIQIYNLFGQNVTRQVEFILNEDTKAILALNNLASGVYFVKTKTAGHMVCLE